MTELRTQGDPIAVDRNIVVSALAQLGIHDCGDIENVLIEGKRIIVTRFLRDRDGRFVLVDDDRDVIRTSNVIAVHREGPHDRTR